MKTFLLVLFKILELAGLVASYFLFAFIGSNIIILGGEASYVDKFSRYNILCFASGLVSVLSIALVVIIIYVLITEFVPSWIEANKRFIDKILK